MRSRASADGSPVGGDPARFAVAASRSSPESGSRGAPSPGPVLASSTRGARRGGRHAIGLSRAEVLRWPASERVAPPMTLSAAFVRGLLSGMSARGVCCEPWLRSVGIDPAVRTDDSARVTLVQFAALMRVMVADCADEMIGLLPRRSKPGSFALQARVAIGARTLESAIGQVIGAFALLHDDVELVSVREGGLAGLAIRTATEADGGRFLHELLLRKYWLLLAWLVGGRLPPDRFDFAFQRPTYADGYGRMFPAERRFDAPMTAVWFEEALLQSPVRRDEVALQSFIGDDAGIVAHHHDAGVGGRVRAYLQRVRPTWPDLERTARELHMSASSLQRNLAAENTSFQEVKDLLRRDIAIARLSTSGVAFAALAAELGFAEAAAFQRAFKGWTGHPPGAYRRRGTRNAGP